MLEKLGLGESALACGPYAPMHPPAAAQLKASGQTPTRLHNNCSGKHAGMLALAATLHAVDALSVAELDALQDFAHPVVLNTRGEAVAEVRTHLRLR